MRWTEAQKSLLANEPEPMDTLFRVHDSAVYAWWDLAGELERYYPAAFPPVDFRQPLYVGLAETNLAQRFRRRHSRRIGQSSPRLSLAALLYKELDLLPGARVQGGKLKLSADAENELTRWMKAYLSFTHAVVDPGDVDSIETMIIGHLLSPLNIQKAVGSPYKTLLELQRVELRRAIQQGS
ncbi:GIY-YIG nuclease family protein [Pseudarthrobacter sp. NPDC058362]|uniref:GIY-YIG nuclease family protein n=1 Tax=Pseudarthrobacter sp. NPDC058362 TaxID=3346458 RepID=UPI00364FCDD2